MQIFVKTLTGKTITLVGTSVPAVPGLMQVDSHLNSLSPAPHGVSRRWRAQTPLTMSRARFRTRRVSSAGSQAASAHGGMSRQMLGRDGRGAATGSLDSAHMGSFSQG